MEIKAVWFQKDISKKEDQFSTMATLSLLEEERPAEEVRLVPILYDKTEKGCKEKDL